MIERVGVRIAPFDCEEPFLLSGLVLFLHPHFYDPENVNRAPFEHERARPFRAAITVIEDDFNSTIYHDIHVPISSCTKVFLLNRKTIADQSVVLNSMAMMLLIATGSLNASKMIRIIKTRP